MQETYEKLRQLQDILSRKYDLEKEISEIPKVLSTKEEMLSRLKKQYVEKNTKTDHIQEKTKTLQHELGEAERKRIESEGKMDSIATQREYEALDKEITEAQELEQRLRRDLLKEKKNLEEMKNTLERDEKLIAAQNTDIEKEKERIEKESAEKQQKLDALTAEEKKITPGMDEEILFKFERIIRNKSGLGIVPVEGNVCKGCHMILPAQFVNDVRKEKGVMFCPYCSRILYYQQPEELSDDAASFVDAEAGGLADLVGDEELE